MLVFLTRNLAEELAAGCFHVLITVAACWHSLDKICLEEKQSPSLSLLYTQDMNGVCLSHSTGVGLVTVLSLASALRRTPSATIAEPRLPAHPFSPVAGSHGKETPPREVTHSRTCDLWDERRAEGLQGSAKTGNGTGTWRASATPQPKVKAAGSSGCRDIDRPLQLRSSQEQLPGLHAAESGTRAVQKQDCCKLEGGAVRIPARTSARALKEDSARSLSAAAPLPSPLAELQSSRANESVEQPGRGSAGSDSLHVVRCAGLGPAGAMAALEHAGCAPGHVDASRASCSSGASTGACTAATHGTALDVPAATSLLRLGGLVPGGGAAAGDVALNSGLGHARPLTYRSLLWRAVAFVLHQTDSAEACQPSGVQRLQFLRPKVSTPALLNSACGAASRGTLHIWNHVSLQVFLH